MTGVAAALVSVALVPAAMHLSHGHAVQPHAHPVITGFAVSPTTLSQFGGVVHITATVSNATTCGLTSSPALAGLPDQTSCSGGAFSDSITVGANDHKSVRWTLTLSATGTATTTARTSFSQASVGTKVTAQWSGPTVLQQDGGPPSAISCGAPSQCVVATTAGAVVPHGGAAVDLTSTGLVSLSCGEATCVGVDTAGDAVSGAGSSWTVDPGVDTDPLTAVSCAPGSGPLYCVAVDQAGRAVTDSASTWSVPVTADTDAALTGVACPERGWCVAVDDTGDGVILSDGTWSSPTAISSAPLTDVSCASATQCVAVDATGDEATWGGSSWSSPLGIDTRAALTAVSCAPGTTTCVATDAVGDVLSWAGAGWSASDRVDPGSYLVGVACPSASWCAIVDENGNEFTGAGVSWSTTTVDAPVGTFDALSCATATSCLALSTAGGARLWNGTAWTTVPGVPGTSFLSVSCVATVCAAGTASGAVLTRTNGDWSAAKSLGEGPVTAVSCFSTTFCLAGTVGGDAASWNGSAWSLPWSVGPPTGLGFGAISCPSATLCVLADNSQNLFAWQPHVALRLAPDAPATQLRGVSCPSVSFCLAIDSYGDTVSLNVGTNKVARASRINENGFTSLSCPTTFFCGMTDAFGNFYSYVSGTRSSAQGVADAGLVEISCVASGFCAAIASDDDAYTATLK